MYVRWETDYQLVSVPRSYTTFSLDLTELAETKIKYSRFYTEFHSIDFFLNKYNVGYIVYEFKTEYVCKYAIIMYCMYVGYVYGQCMLYVCIYVGYVCRLFMYEGYMYACIMYVGLCVFIYLQPHCTDVTFYFF